MFEPISDQDADSAPPKTSPIADLIFVRIPYVVTGTLLCAAIAINFANVVARYFFFEALYWAEEVLIYNVCDHEACFEEVGSQAISYTAGVPAVAAAMLIANGTWDRREMVNVEELDPVPFIALMNRMGLVTRIRDAEGDRVLRLEREVGGKVEVGMRANAW